MNPDNYRIRMEVDAFKQWVRDFFKRLTTKRGKRVE